MFLKMLNVQLFTTNNKYKIYCWKTCLKWEFGIVLWTISWQLFIYLKFGFTLMRYYLTARLPGGFRYRTFHNLLAACLLWATAALLINPLNFWCSVVDHTSPALAAYVFMQASSSVVLIRIKWLVYGPSMVPTKLEKHYSEFDYGSDVPAIPM